MPIDKARFNTLMRQADEIQKELDAILPDLARARTVYMRSRAAEDEAALDRIQAEASAMSERYGALEPQMKEALGMTDEELEALSGSDAGEVSYRNVMRGELRAENVTITGMVDDQLPLALERIEAMLPPGWLALQPDVSHRLDSLVEGHQALSLVKGLRPESETPALHRFRQMIRVSRDYLDSHPSYDLFAGATLIPQLAHLGSRLHLLEQVGGDVQGRLRRLWDGPSEQVDSVVFELLVAMACVEKGRQVEFIEETFEKTPDVRCHDPIPMVIECKRKRSLSDYEIREEVLVRNLFEALREEATRQGIFGRFELRLTREMQLLDASDLVRTMLRQRLVAHPERPLDYDWGSVAFVPLARHIALEGTTRAYSPEMLRQAFEWDSDLPDWDGLVCRVSCSSHEIDEIDDPIALVWINTSENAVRRRAWSPMDLVGSAMSQIPPGEFGMIYLAYHEGAREEISNRRVEAFMDRMPEWEHSGAIRVPLALLVRLYPRPLGHGGPDLIESSLRFVSSAYGNPELFDYFPQSVFTITSHSRTVE